MKPGSPEIYDYEYVRKGTANIFVAVEPKTEKRITKVTKRRTKKDFAMFVKEVLDRYPKARKLPVFLHVKINDIIHSFPVFLIYGLDAPHSSLPWFCVVFFRISLTDSLFIPSNPFFFFISSTIRRMDHLFLP